MTSNDWNAAIDAALSKVREQRAVFSSDAYATPQPIGGFMERFACNSIEVEIEALRKPDTPPTPATDAPAFSDHGCIYCRAQGSDCEGPHRFAADEREALGATVSAFWDTKDTVESCINAVLSALAPYRAAEILAAEARGHADADREIASWLYDGDICECCGCMSIAAREVERGKHRKAGK